MSEKKQFDINFWDIFHLLWNNRKHVIIVIVIACVLAIILSSPLVIKPKYKAEVVFYPTTVNSISNALLTDLNKREADLLSFGEEEQAENALQLLNSSKLLNKFIDNFNLYEHYEINRNGKMPRYKMQRKINSNVKFKRTRHLAISITVLDENPEKAAEFANGIAAIYDSVKTQVHQQVAMEALVILEDRYEEKKQEVWDIRTRLKELAEKGILNYEEQSRAIAEEIYKVGTNTPKGKALREDQDALAKYAGEFTFLNETLILELENLSIAQKRYEKAKVDVEKTLPHKFELTRADIPERKSYPVRWLIMVATLMASFFSVTVVLIVLDALKRNKSKTESVA
jgi:uncharacterized protein involved in exopolysaccharide biosynthesis